MKTARFAALVKTAGAPSVHLAWSAPAHDPVLRRALRQNRLVTVHTQSRGGKKDYAGVGLEPERHAQFLIFPKSVRRFSKRRIVGVNYDLIGGALSAGPLPKKARGKFRAKSSPPALRVLPSMAPTTPMPAPPSAPAAATPPTDPILKEVWLALAALRKGHLRLAQQRLQGLLDHAAADHD